MIDLVKDVLSCDRLRRRSSWIPTRPTNRRRIDLRLLFQCPGELTARCGYNSQQRSGQMMDGLGSAVIC